MTSPNKSVSDFGLSIRRILGSCDQGPVRTRRGVRNKFSKLGFELLENRSMLSGDFAFAAGMGGTGIDQGVAIATDGLGNLYTTGRFQGTVDFDPGAGTLNLTSAGSRDIFVSKLNSAGNFVLGRTKVSETDLLEFTGNGS